MRIEANPPCELARLALARTRREAARSLALAMTEAVGAPLPDLEQLHALLWSTLKAFANYPFRTAKGLRYSYIVRGNELFVSRKEKSVTRATVNIALDRALILRRTCTPISGPKKLGCFGASYLYPVFGRVGILGDRV